MPSYRAYTIPTLLLGSRGKLWGHVVGYSVTAVIAWLLTWGTYHVLNNHLLGRPQLSALVAQFVAKMGATATAPTTNVPLTVAKSGRQVLQLDFKEEFFDGATSLLTVTVVGTPSSDPDYKTEPLKLFVLDPATPRWLFPASFTITSPASIHVVHKAVLATLEDFRSGRNNAVKKNKLALDEADIDVLSEQVSRALDTTLGQIPSRVSWARQLNGPIQAFTVLAFWALIIQIGCRFVLYCWLEWRIRDAKANETLWTRDEEVLTRQRIIPLMEAVATARRDLEERTSLAGCHAGSCYFDLFFAAGSAYMVNGDYNAVPGFVESEANGIGEERNASSGIVKYLLWSIPTIGFVGTVVGIGDALLQTVNVDSVDPVMAAIAKSTISTSIGVAFDTTLVALILSLIGMLLYHLQMQLQDLALARAKDLILLLFVRPGESIDMKQLERILTAQYGDLRRIATELRGTAQNFQVLQRQHHANVKPAVPRALVWAILGVCLVTLAGVILGVLVASGAITL